jgi:hypothetical protein
MSDVELLELAAKAAGLDIVMGDNFGTPWPMFRNNGAQWSPLTDDGDAFRLAVKLGQRYPCCVIGTFSRAAFPHSSASVVHRDGSETYIEQDASDDLGAATRRAIVRAAAVIGGEQ